MSTFFKMSLNSSKSPTAKLQRITEAGEAAAEDDEKDVASALRCAPEVRLKRRLNFAERHSFLFESQRAKRQRHQSAARRIIIPR